MYIGAAGLRRHGRYRTSTRDRLIQHTSRGIAPPTGHIHSRYRAGSAGITPSSGTRMVSRGSLLAALLSLASLLSFSDAALTFTARTLSAAWSPRWDSNLEWYPHPVTVTLTNGTSRTWQGRMMILQGNGNGGNANGATNDIWASPDLGSSWYLIAGIASNGQAFGPYAQSSFKQVLSRPATGVDAEGHIFRISGLRSDGVRPQSSVWYSDNGGIYWQNTQEQPGARPFQPGRDRASLMVDSRDNLYLLGGQSRTEGNGMTNTVFRSSDHGVSWTRLAPYPWSPRASGIFLSHYSKSLGVDVLTYFTGWDGTYEGLFNEVWISADLAANWAQVKTNWNAGLPPFMRRDAANGEITSNGIMILVGGQTVHPENQTMEALNDVWVTMDGGYQWGLCNWDAPFDDRRDLLTMLDGEGFLYVAGGQNWGNDRVYNDVWRSSISFNDVGAVSRECGLPVPACGPGIACFPGDPHTTFLSNGTVTCPATRKCAGLPDAYMDFDIATRAAQFSPRYWANAEYFPKSISYRTPTGTQKTAVNPLIVHGGDVTTNDVWLSSDRGQSWELIAGVGAYQTQATSSFYPVHNEATAIVDNKNGYIIRVGGRIANTGGQSSNDVWVTQDAVTWTRFQPATLPGRAEPALIVDGNGKLFLLGGRNGSSPVADMHSSTNLGQSWSQIHSRVPFMTGSGRTKGFFLHKYSAPLQRDVLYYGAGWDGVNLYNDVWASSDEGQTWSAVTATAPWTGRDAVGGEITEDGLIVIAGGQTQNWQENDVWVSADGGYTWGACSTEAFWSDRRDATTVLDGQGYFYVIGGRLNANAGAPKYNDVYRSHISLDDLSAVADACGIIIPKCGAGLTCWPGAPGTVVTSTGVTCPALVQCSGGDTRSSSSSATVRRSSSSSSTGGRTPYCQIFPEDPICNDLPDCDEDPEDPACQSSTGGGVTPSSGLSTGAVIAIVFVVMLVAGVGAWYYYKKCHKTEEPTWAMPADTSKASGANETLLTVNEQTGDDGRGIYSNNDTGSTDGSTSVSAF